MKRLFLAAVALLASASFATAQTQRVPTALDPGGRVENSQPAAIMIAPAGGVSGPGTVVAPDHPLPVTGTFTLPAGGATAAKQDTGNTSLGSIDTKLSSQATAAAQATGNASLGSIDTKLSSQATAAKQDTGNTSLATIVTNTTGAATAANQTTANGSLATIATNTTGAATAANQATANGSLSAISGKLPAALGQATKANSLSVTIASDQTQATSTSAAVTITTALTFQSVLASNSNRKGCFIQNKSADVEEVFFGANGSATVDGSVDLQPGQTISCNSSGLVATDNISMTSKTLNGAKAVVISQ